MATPDVQIEVATVEHAEQLARVMRAEDAAELEATGAGSPLDGVLTSLRSSDLALTLLLDGEVAAIWGTVPLEYPRACAWLLTGRMVDRHPKAFLRVCRLGAKQLLEHYPVLTNQVDARYLRAVRWANWLGFDVGPASPLPSGALFHPIEMRRHHGRIL